MLVSEGELGLYKDLGFGSEQHGESLGDYAEVRGDPTVSECTRPGGHVGHRKYGTRVTAGRTF